MNSNGLVEYSLLLLYYIFDSMLQKASKKYHLPLRSYILIIFLPVMSIFLIYLTNPLSILSNPKDFSTVLFFVFYTISHLGLSMHDQELVLHLLLIMNDRPS
jgi:hypothetical protein